MNALNILQSLLKIKKQRHPPLARFLHWLYGPALLSGMLSGFYIKNPYRLRSFSSMDSAKKVHSMSQYVLISSYLARIYYGYVTKNYKQIIPNRKDLAGMPKFLKYQFFLTKKKPKFPKYNPGQKFLFTGFALLVPVQIITGLALHTSNSFKIPAIVLGGMNPLRKLHYLTALTVSSFAAGHLYFVFTDSLQKLKSIFTGFK